MKKFALVSLIVAVVLVLVGTISMFAVLSSQNFDLSFLNVNLNGDTNLEFVTTKYEVDEKFDSVNIDETSADISIILTKEKNAYVETFCSENVTYDVAVKGKTLNIQRKEKNSVSLFSVGTPDSYLNVYLPEKDYKDLVVNATSSDILINTDLTFENADVECTSGIIELSSIAKNDVKLHTTSGEIYLSDVECKTIGVSSTSGTIEIENVKTSGGIDVHTTSGEINIENIFTCKTLNANSTSGEVNTYNVVSTDYFSVDTTSGEIELIDCECENINLKSNSGDISGQLLSSKVFVTNTASGDVSIDPSAYGDTGKCEVRTTSGDITFSIRDSE